MVALEHFSRDFTELGGQGGGHGEVDHLEAVAECLLQVLRPKVPVKRIVFHEITEEAIRDALNHTQILAPNSTPGSM